MMSWLMKKKTNNQWLNIPNHQEIPANIFSRGQYIARDLKKAIHYHTLVANQECQKEKINFGSSDINAITQNII